MFLKIMSAVPTTLTTNSNGEMSIRSDLDRGFLEQFTLEEEGCEEADHLIMPQTYTSCKPIDCKQHATTREPLLAPLSTSSALSYTYSNHPTTSIGKISSHGCAGSKEHKGAHLRGSQKKESLLTDEIELGEDGGTDSDELDLLPTLSPSTSSSAKLGGGRGWRRLRRLMGCCGAGYSPYWLPPSLPRCSLM